MEVWKDIVNLSGYQISSCGQVRSVDRIIKQRTKSGEIKDVLHKGKILAGCVTGRKRNAKGVSIRKDGLSICYKIHRLMAQAFLENPDDLPVVDHIDRNPFNNVLTNLRWASYSTNAQNTGPHITNTSGHKNISYDKRRNKWRLFKMIDGVTTFKRYDTLEEAISERDKLLVL